MIVSTGLDRTMKIFDPEHESGNRNMGKCVLFHKSDKREHQVNIFFTDEIEKEFFFKLNQLKRE